MYKDKKENLIYLFKLMIFCALLTQTTNLTYKIGANAYTQFEILTSSELDENDIKNKIYASSKLTEEEKDYIYNSDFFTDLLSTTNNYKYMCYKYEKCFDDMDIVSFPRDNIKSGYYDSSEPNTIHVVEYKKLNLITKDIVAHELIHLCQNNNCQYNFITESTAEIISYEYFPSTQLSSYNNEITYLKILMEIIGPEPIWEYVFSANFTLIENSVKPYLNDDEYEKFLTCLKMNPYDKNERNVHIITLNNLFEVLYKNKYGKDINDDEIINCLKNNQIYINRFYFNQRHINPEESYYLDVKLTKYTIEEAITNNILTLFCDGKCITYDEYIKIADKSVVEYLVKGILDDDGNVYVYTHDTIYIPTIYERDNKILKR